MFVPTLQSLTSWVSLPFYQLSTHQYHLTPYHQALLLFLLWLNGTFVLAFCFFFKTFYFASTNYLPCTQVSQADRPGQANIAQDPLSSPKPSQLPPPFDTSIDSNHLSVHLMSSDSARYQRSACRTCLFPAPLAQMHHTAIAFSQQSPVLAYSLHSSSKHQSASIIPSHSVFKSGGSKHAQ